MVATGLEGVVEVVMVVATWAVGWAVVEREEVVAGVEAEGVGVVTVVAEWEGATVGVDVVGVGEAAAAGAALRAVGKEEGEGAGAAVAVQAGMHVAPERCSMCLPMYTLQLCCCNNHGFHSRPGHSHRRIRCLCRSCHLQARGL